MQDQISADGLPGDVMERTEISLDAAFVSNRNPRIVEHRTPDEEEEVVYTHVQDEVIDVMYDGPFGMEEIEGSIENNGLLKMSTMIVIPYQGETTVPDEAYEVIEGNRRVAAAKRLREKYSENPPTKKLSRIVSDLETIEVLVLDPEAVDNVDALVAQLQGLCHINGTKDWGPFQKAQGIENLLDAGIDMDEVRDRFGDISTRKLNWYRKAYSTAKQMKDDSEFGDDWQPDHYSFFEEAIKKPDVREWLGWDPETYTFTNDEHRREFYEWFLGNVDSRKKITKAIDVRKLAEILGYEASDKFVNRLRNRELTLEEVYSDYQQEIRERNIVERDWEAKFREMRDLILDIPADYFATMEPHEVERMNELYEAIEKQLDRQQKLQ